MTSIKTKVERFAEDYRALKFNKGYVAYSGSSRAGSHIRNLTEMFSHATLSNRSIELWAINEAGGICYGCLKPVFILKEGKVCLSDENNPEARDHILPASKGYLYTLGNVGLMHAVCNGEKSDMTLQEYYEYLRSKKNFTEEQIEECKGIIKTLQKPIRDNKDFKEFIEEISLINEELEGPKFSEAIHKAFIRAADKKIIKYSSGGVSSKDLLLKKIEGTILSVILDDMDFDKKHSLAFLSEIFDSAIEKNVDLNISNSFHLDNFIEVCKVTYKLAYIESEVGSSKRSRSKSTVKHVFNVLDSLFQTNFENDVELYSKTKIIDVTSKRAPQIIQDVSYIVSQTSVSVMNERQKISEVRRLRSDLERRGFNLESKLNFKEMCKVIQEERSKAQINIDCSSYGRYNNVTGIFLILLRHPDFVKFFKDLENTVIKNSMKPTIGAAIIREFNNNPNIDLDLFFKNNFYKRIDETCKNNYSKDKTRRFEKFALDFINTYSRKMSFDTDSSTVNKILINQYLNKKLNGTDSKDEKKRRIRYAKNLKECLEYRKKSLSTVESNVALEESKDTVNNNSESFTKVKNTKSNSEKIKEKSYSLTPIVKIRMNSSFELEALRT